MILRGFAWSLLLLAACSDDGRRPTAPALPFAIQDSPCSEIDDLNDGTINTVYNYKYDAAGFVIQTSTEGFTATIVYGKDHFPTHVESDTTGDGVADQLTDTTRDDEGRPLQSERTEIDPTQRAVTTVTSTYDSAGRLTAQAGMKVVTPTAGAPTTTTATTTVTYTGDSLIPSEVVEVRAAGTSRSTYTQSDGGRTVDISVDDDDDGVIDTTIHEIYDADRQLLAEDDSAMGMVNFRLRQTYDDRGAELTYGLDFDGTDPLDVSETTVYAGGMRASRAAVSPSGMFNDVVYTETWKDTCVAAVPRSASARGRVDVRTLQDRGRRLRAPAQR